MKYAVELDRDGPVLDLGIIHADSDEEAREKARIWARLLNPARRPAWVRLEKANGTKETFHDGAAQTPGDRLDVAAHMSVIG